MFAQRKKRTNITKYGTRYYEKQKQAAKARSVSEAKTDDQTCAKTDDKTDSKMMLKKQPQSRAYAPSDTENTAETVTVINESDSKTRMDIGTEPDPKMHKEDINDKSPVSVNEAKPVMPKDSAGHSVSDMQDPPSPTETNFGLQNDPADDPLAISPEMSNISTTQAELYSLIRYYLYKKDKNTLTDTILKQIQSTDNIEKFSVDHLIKDCHNIPLHLGDIISVTDFMSEEPKPSAPYAVIYIFGYHTWRENSQASKGLMLMPVKEKKNGKYKLCAASEMHIAFHCFTGHEYDCMIKEDDQTQYTKDMTKYIEKIKDARLTESGKEEIKNRQTVILTKSSDNIKTASHNAYHAMEIMEETELKKNYASLVRIESVSRRLIQNINELRSIMESYMIARYERNLS